MSENGITHYCLGNGALKCDGCGQEKNWQTLNQMPDTLQRQRHGASCPTQGAFSRRKSLSGA